MGKNVFLTTILVILVVADVTNAAFFFNVRKLTAPSPKEDPKATVSPIPSPVAIEKQSNPDGDGGKKGKEKHGQQPTPPSTSGEEKGKGKEKDKSKDDKQVKNPTGVIPPAAKVESKTPPKKEEVKEKKSDLPTGGGESCDGIGRRCQDTKSMIACVKSSDDELKALVLVIMNEGDSALKVDLKIPSVYNQKVDISKHQSRKVEIPLANGVSNEITLNAGNGDCILHLGAPTLQGNFFKWVPSYSKFMTPIYGAYLLLIATFISGSIWACCWFGRRKRQSDIPYQELEMSVPETAAVAVDTAEGWDQDWDDDWDEEKAVRSPGGPNISSNGLTSRTPKKDGWEDWDD